METPSSKPTVVKPAVVFKFDKQKCINHLEALRVEAMKRVGEVGHNPYFFISRVIEPNLKMLNDDKCERTEAFQNSILGIKCETKI